MNYDSSQMSYCWSLPADLFLVNRHVRAISARIFFSRNEFVVNLMYEPVVPAPKDLIWGPTDTGHGPSPLGILGTWHPSHSIFLLTFPSVCIPMLKSVHGNIFLCFTIVSFSVMNWKPTGGIRSTSSLGMCNHFPSSLSPWTCAAAELNIGIRLHARYPAMRWCFH